MIRILLLALSVCALAACTVTPLSPPQATPLATEVDPEEYAIFSALIEQNVVGYQLGESLAIREQTDPDIDLLELALQGPVEAPTELVEAFRLRNDQPYTLDSSFTLKQAYQLMPQSEYEALLRTGGANWEEFEAKYPGAGGVFIFSRAGLNAAGNEALVSAGYYCGSLCGEGGMFLMVKEDGVWKVREELVAWMS